MNDQRRFLTTHVGSLPRPDELKQLMFAREDGLVVDPSALDEQVARAVELVVNRQLKAGLDIINDGEMPKPSYATYVKDRLTGFGGSGNSYVFQDLEAYPGTKARMFDDPGRKHRKAPACNAPVSMRDLDAPKQDAQRLQRSLGGRAPAGMFLNAASPGVTTLFFRNDFYPNHEEYLFACADALRLEYEAIVASGVTLQIDCPDLAMGRHTQFAHLDRNGFRDRMALHVEALNRALVNIPAEKVRMHLCWGNYPGPHHCDVPLEGKILVPGVIECQSSYIEHPELVAQRIGRYANLVGRENVMAAVDCGFSIHVGTSGIDPEVIWGKLEALAQGAAIASGRFWR
jgi:5-methyltetrahydropteroyltriglutamate--homocysteine methyltransferase